MNIQKVQEDYASDLQAIRDICEGIYGEQFSEYFKDLDRLHKHMLSTTDPISDADLEWILVDLPLNLFSVGEVVNRFKLEIELIKSQAKCKKRDFKLDPVNDYMSDTRRQDLANSCAVEEEFLASAYTTILTRVEHQIAFAKELIMGAKKVWDGRRAVENVMPVGCTEDSQSEKSDLPEYRPSGQTYIK